MFWASKVTFTGLQTISSGPQPGPAVAVTSLVQTQRTGSVAWLLGLLCVLDSVLIQSIEGRGSSTNNNVGFSGADLMAAAAQFAQQVLQEIANAQGLLEASLITQDDFAAASSSLLSQLVSNNRLSFQEQRDCLVAAKQHQVPLHLLQAAGRKLLDSRIQQLVPPAQAPAGWWWCRVRAVASRYELVPPQETDRRLCRALCLLLLADFCTYTKHR